MAETTPCPGCGKSNRVPAAATGTPVCGVCGAHLPWIVEATAKEKFTLAELEEEEQSLDRLRRWHRELSLRDTFGAQSAGEASVALKESTERLEGYAERVYRALGH